MVTRDHETAARTESRRAYAISILTISAIAALGWAGMTFLDNLHTSQPRPIQTQNAAPVSPKVALTPPKTPPAHPHVIPEAPIRLPSTNERNAQGKQVVFNDQNYRPNPNINIIPAQKTQHTPSSKPAPQPRVSISTHSAPWHWVGANREKTGGQFVWTETNRQIDYSTVCQNYSRGSFPYRDCRKGAKQAFARLCRQGRAAACHAENNYMP